MIRTFAVLLLLVGLATATPVVCLCAPAEAAGLTGAAADAGASGRLASTDDPAGSVDAPSLVATSAAAVVASLITAAGGLRPSAPWRLPGPAVVRWQPAVATVMAGPTRSPMVPPPR